MTNVGFGCYCCGVKIIFVVESVGVVVNLKIATAPAATATQTNAFQRTYMTVYITLSNFIWFVITCKKYLENLIHFLNGNYCAKVCLA